MRFCKYCGAEVAETDLTCPACGNHIGSPKSSNIPQPEKTDESVNNKDYKVGEKEQNAASSALSTRSIVAAVVESTQKTVEKMTENRRLLYISAGVVGALFLILLTTFSGRCKADGCRNRKAPGTDYCYNHKCDVNGCKEQRLSYSNYCYEHHLLYDREEEKSRTYSWEMDISDVIVYSEYSFTYAEGTLTNNSSSTVKYVKIKGAFKSQDGRVIDTDWTYAVGGEGLAPGESCKWKMMVTKDLNIKNCEVTIMDDD